MCMYMDMTLIGLNLELHYSVGNYLVFPIICAANLYRSYCFMPQLGTGCYHGRATACVLVVILVVRICVHH